MFDYSLSEIGTVGHALFSTILPVVALIVGIGVALWLVDFLIGLKSKSGEVK
jgi:hypothetical protein